MAILGRRNQLSIIRDTPHGLLLDGESRGEILLPRRYQPTDASPGSKVDVFVYRDSEDRLVATTEHPKAMDGDFASLKIVGHRAGIGAFLDWGLSKDLLLPLREQSGYLQIGDMVVVRVFVDEKSDRIAASMRLNRYLDHNPPAFEKDHPVKLLVSGVTPLGYNAIVENKWQGMLYHTDLAAPLQPGQLLTGYVRHVRVDGKLDLGLDRSGFGRIKPLRDQILEKLKGGGGHLPLHDGSSPEEIRTMFGVSKKAFKQATGALYKKRLIRIAADGIHLTDPEGKRDQRS